MFAHQALFGSCSYFVSKAFGFVADVTGISTCSRWCARKVARQDAALNPPSVAKATVVAQSQLANVTSTQPALRPIKNATDEKAAVADQNSAFNQAPPYMQKLALLIRESVPSLSLALATDIGTKAGGYVWNGDMDMRYDLLLQYEPYREDFEPSTKRITDPAVFERHQQRRLEYAAKLAFSDALVSGIMMSKETPDGQPVEGEPFNIDLHGIPLTTTLVHKIAELCPDARSLNLSDCFLASGGFPSQLLMTAVRTFTHLEILDLSGNDAMWIFPRALSRFFQHRGDEPQVWHKLHTLSLQRVFNDLYAAISVEQLAVLQALPRLTTLDLSNNATFGTSDMHAEIIAGIKGLKTLIARDCKDLTPAFLKKLSELAPALVVVS